MMSGKKQDPFALYEFSLYTFSTYTNVKDRRSKHSWKHKEQNTGERKVFHASASLPFIYIFIFSA